MVIENVKDVLLFKIWSCFNWVIFMRDEVLLGKYLFFEFVGVILLYYELIKICGMKIYLI